ncbi:putative polysaccharide biosynthesis protein [Anaeromicropila herbilytica]|uniref:Polysaccharide biosynthesis protein n=1 Tax=Anaeromicropila herbilytica TaxID=2785025 RepID=A0A7R7EMB6_9FIRM|nr:polysaccharide biosynthesis protein [Anaeromicropila herbilytica]BCN31600.1 polysaccharide biosynthesis protein [Anaeromicropila herbilytica]
MSKSSILKGTIILTLAGFLTRFIGFFYRIYLSNALGAENMGVYQLIFAVYGICFTLYASGIQTSISRFVAAEVGQNHIKNARRILKIGLILSVSIALTCSIVTYLGSDYISIHLLAEPRCSDSIKILAFIYPFCGMTACINGYYYGLKKTFVPASTQLLEQIVRVISVYFIALYFGNGDNVVTCELAILGVALGEIASDVYSLLSLLFENKKANMLSKVTLRLRTIMKELLKVSIPLTGNRLLLALLHSFEAILIPIMLKKSGLSTADALSIYGVLTGMAIPFIMFPSTITNSFAVMLLPTVSEAQAVRNNSLIDRTTTMSIKYSLIIGILSTGIFMIFGNALGVTIYNNATAGVYLTVLSWLCPFLYLTTTLSSIINGLGKTHITFFNSIVGLAIRIFSILFFIPKYGIAGYLIGTLVSQLAITTLDVAATYRNIHADFDAVNWLLKPSIIIAILGYFTYHSYEFLIRTTNLSALLLLFISCIALTLGYILCLFVSGAMSKKEFGK